MAASSSSSSSSSSKKYDVFISFRGEDTRGGFTTYLYHALDQKYIHTYMDEKSLESGSIISPTLKKAIQESKICIIILSQKFASSRWCLDELVQILECKRNENGQNVIPIFYGVDPSIVRKQERSYEDAFANHEQHFSDKVQQWRDALKEVANLSGYDSRNFRAEHELVEKIVEDILLKLRKYQETNDEHLIGIKEPREKIESLLSIGTMDVRIIGICGMGGIGKTSLAEIVFRKFSNSHFDGHCFLKDNPEEADNTHHLRLQLLSELLKDKNVLCTNTLVVGSSIQDRLRNKKVFIVLDNLNGSITKLKDLLEGCQFAKGSRIIVTTRDVQLLRTMDGRVFELKGLNHFDALKLFRLHASPAPGYEALSNSFADYTKGNPLALKVLGSSLKSKSIKEWESAFNKLETDPNAVVQEVLRISYDGLGDEGIQGIFLDMASFYTGEVLREDAESILNRTNHSDAVIGISVLIDKCLLIERQEHSMKAKLEMHDLIRQMGRKIVCDESKDFGNRSRLWDEKAICHVLEKNTGTSAIEGISLYLDSLKKNVKVSPTAFSKMSNLRFFKMQLESSNFLTSETERNKLKKICLPDGLESIASDELRYFQWDSYPLKYLPYFSPENLVELIMPRCQLELLWNEDQPLELVKLKRIDLSDSNHLIRIPNFSRATNLEYINLRGCKSLVEAPSFFQEDGIENLPLNLRYLDLDETAIKSFALSIVKLKYLRVVNLAGCSNLAEIEFNGTEIDELKGTEIEELNETEIGDLLFSNRLDLSDCERLKVLPESIWKLKFVKWLNLSYCPNLGKLPEISDCMEGWYEIVLKGTGIEELPESIGNLVNLIQLDLSECERLKVLPESIWELEFLESLDLSYCPNLGKFPEISYRMEKLSTIKLNRTGIEELPESIESLVHLKSLDLSGCKRFKVLPKSISKLEYLESLDISYCPNLEKIPEFSDPMECLHEIKLKGTGIEELPESIENLTRLEYLDLGWLPKIKFLPNSLGKLSSLERLNLEECSSLEELPPLPHGLYELKIENCKRLKLIRELPSTLHKLYAKDCTSLETISTWGSATERYFPRKDCIYKFKNCLKLDDNTRSNVIADHVRLQTLSPYNKVEIEYPGHEIPEWFRYQTDAGNSINLRLPPNWPELRYVICIVCGLLDNDDDDCLMEVEYEFNFKTNTSNSDDLFHSYRGRFPYDDFINSDYVVIVRDPPYSFQRVYNYFKNKYHIGFDLSKVSGPKRSSIHSNVTEASFSVFPMLKGCVKKFGIQLFDKSGNEVPNVDRDSSKRGFGECSSNKPNGYQHNHDSHPHNNSKRIKLMGQYITLSLPNE